MNLEDIYTSRVQGKTSSMFNLCINGSSPTFERDPEVLKLENDTFSQLRELCFEPTSPVQVKAQTSPTNISFVSFEDALKELKSSGVNI